MRLELRRAPFGVIMAFSWLPCLLGMNMFLPALLLLRRMLVVTVYSAGPWRTFFLDKGAVEELSRISLLKLIERGRDLPLYVLQQWSTLFCNKSRGKVVSTSYLLLNNPPACTASTSLLLILYYRFRILKLVYL